MVQRVASRSFWCIVSSLGGLPLAEKGSGCTNASSHKWEAYRRRRFCRFSRRERRAYLNPYVRSEQRRKSVKNVIGPPGWLEKGLSASLLVRYVSQRIRSSLAPSIQTLLKPTVRLLLMRRCTIFLSRFSFVISPVSIFSVTKPTSADLCRQTPRSVEDVTPTNWCSQVCVGLLVQTAQFLKPQPLPE